MKKTFHSSLSLRLVLYIVICSSVITFILTANQFYRDYQTDVRIINDGFKQIESVHLKSIAATVWSTNYDKLQTIIEGISNLRDVEQVVVSEDNNVLASVGTLKGENPISNTYPITHEFNGKKIQIGTLKVVANLDFVFQRVLDRAIFILFSNAIKTSIVAGFMLLIFHYVVIRHLVEISNYISAISLNDKTKPLVLSHKKRASHETDELDRVVDSINNTAKRVGKAFTDLQIAEEEKLGIEEQQRDILNNTSSVIYIKDIDGRFLFINRMFEKLFHISNEKINGKKDHDLFSKEEADAFRVNDLKILETDSLMEFEEGASQNDGLHLYLSVKFPLKNISGETYAICGISTDITERKLAEKLVQEALAEAKLANQAKSEFLATMSHEFRTPLNAILGFSEMMRAQYFGPLGSDNYKDYAEDIHDSGEHMLALINDMLDIAAIEAGKRSMVREEVDVAVILGNSIRNVEQLAKNEGVKISLDVPSEVLTVYADKRSATQIVYNILSNAIKFTPTGGEIDISAAATGEGTEIKIGDTGVGISADKLPTITEPFSQMHSDPHLTQQGTGLGLSIVKSLVEANRGVLKIESELGKGTTVTVAFPLNDIDSEESHQT